MLGCGFGVCVISGIWLSRSWSVNCMLKRLSGSFMMCRFWCRILKCNCVLVVRWFGVKLSNCVVMFGSRGRLLLMRLLYC